MAAPTTACVVGVPIDGAPLELQASHAPFFVASNKKIGSDSIHAVPRPSRLSRGWIKFKKIWLLLATGYATEDARKKYERTENWSHFHATLMKKLENIGIVSGLLLSANTNLLCSGELRRMTYTAVMASIVCSLLSIVFGLLCLWSLIGVHPTRLKFLIRTDAILFYYLHSTPSLFGGASALCFFVAVGAWTWLDHPIVDHGWGGRVLSIFLSAALIINATLCFVLGASTWEDGNNKES